MKKLAKTFLPIFLASYFLISCGGSNSENKQDVNAIETNSVQNNSSVSDPNSTPETVMNTIFQAANTGEVGILKFLLPPYEQGECDGDCKALCNPGNESMKSELRNNYISMADFKEGFSKGKIVGAATINGNDAEVNFLFGPNLENNETMKLQKINGKWYLKGF